MILATDLDRTLLPNGRDSYSEGSIEKLFALLDDIEHVLMYVSGRNLDLMLESVKEYGDKLPDYFIGEVGTRIYQRRGDHMQPLESWQKHVHADNPSWDREVVVSTLKERDKLELQEGWKQNEFKVSYYLKHHSGMAEEIKSIRSALQKAEIGAEIIDSYDPLQKLGLIDILPHGVSKLSAIEFVRGELQEPKSSLVYCGDSGNDLLPLTFGYKAIAVNNTPDDIKKRIRHIAAKKEIEDMVYIAKGSETGNGNYANGIIEGLRHFDVVI